MPRMDVGLTRASDLEIQKNKTTVSVPAMFFEVLPRIREWCTKVPLGRPEICSECGEHGRIQVVFKTERKLRICFKCAKELRILLKSIRDEEQYDEALEEW